MGSMIGDYIHHRAEGYDKHGITLAGEYTPPNTKSIGNLISQYLNSTGTGATKAELEEMEKAISSFMTEPTQEREKAYAIIEEKLAQKYQEEMNNGTQWNVEMAKLEGIDLSKGLGQLHSHHVEGSSKMYMDLKEVTNKINKLEQIYLEKIGQKETNIKEWRELRESYQNFVGTSAKKMKSYDFLNNPLGLKIEGTYKEVGKLRDQLNAMIEQYASYPAIVGVEGMGFEYIVAAALMGAEKVTDENLDSYIVGDKTQRVTQYKSDNINMQAITAKLGEKTTLDVMYNQRAKIDIQISWEGIDAKISAKNVAFKDEYTWATVQGGSPFLSMIQDINPDFVNHWINIHAIKGSSEKAKIYGDPLDDTMKRVLFYKALTGQGAMRAAADQANLMVINDKTKRGGVTVVDMKTLYKKALNSTFLLSVKLGGKTIKNYHLKNVKAETWQERLNAITLQLHELKAFVSFNANSRLLTK